MTEESRPGPLQQAATAFDQGDLPSCLAHLTALDRAACRLVDLADADRLQTLSAFRLGEMSQAVDSARRFLAHVDAGLHSALEQRFDVIGVLVVAAGQLGEFEESIERARDLLNLSTRLGGLAHWVRARGNSASSLTLLGDHWRARRVLQNILQRVRSEPQAIRLESTAFNNLATVDLSLARLALAAQDAVQATESLENARHSVARAAEIAQVIGDPRVSVMSRLNRIELGLLAGETFAQDGVLADAIADARRNGLDGHWRKLTLLAVELLLRDGEHQAALDRIDEVRADTRDGHDVFDRMRTLELHAVALRRIGRAEESLLARDAFETLAAWCRLRQAKAQSTLLRTRLEVEFLFQHSPLASPDAR